LIQPKGVVEIEDIPTMAWAVGGQADWGIDSAVRGMRNDDAFAGSCS
jgi:hypothetical protein